MRRGWRRPFGILLQLYMCYVVSLSDLWVVRYFAKAGRNTQAKDSSSARGMYDRKLAVVVPMHHGDVARAMESMQKWPATCSRDSLIAMDLVLYYAELVDEDEILARLPVEASRCFRSTYVVTANLTDEENVYPIGPSVQFYKLFLSKEVSEKFVQYDAIACLEWDVIVAHERSFGRLYHAAFSATEPFWMKGSTLAGTEFHETATVSRMWFVLGHLNGNAIYNNSDPAFTEFVNYTFNRWNHTYPYDVALWASISDFPYSWLLWQRYSTKFVATNLISNVGFHNAHGGAVEAAVATDTLFIHGRASSGGSQHHKAVTVERSKTRGALDCTAACRNHGSSGLTKGLSTVCDQACSESDDPRLGCGANNKIVFGGACRVCYNDHTVALAAQSRWTWGQALQANDDNPYVIMCNTRQPPSAMECSPKCSKKADTVCDSKCGSGQFGDYHCNWRSLGLSCRYCFHDLRSARLADEVASTRGGRVIMCSTHQPPHYAEAAHSSIRIKRRAKPARSVVSKTSSANKRQGIEDPANIRFNKNITRGQICAFVPGYLEFFAETNLTVTSIGHFMPGVKIALATQPIDFHVYNRSLGQMPAVIVFNTSRVDLAALVADHICGRSTKLIYYMTPGQIMSRSFTFKDTHSARGDLLVIHADVKLVDKLNILRALATTRLLGFHAPSFTFGTDLLLPADINAHLRNFLLPAVPSSPNLPARVETVDELEIGLLEKYVSAMNISANLQSHVYVPEVLAALAYSRNPAGLHFTNPSQWTHNHLFAQASIWDIPVVKAPFSCRVDLSLSVAGYDLATELQGWLHAFRHGARCDRGFVEIPESRLAAKSECEFCEASPNSIPAVKDYSVSVMYRTFSRDAQLFNVSFPTVLKHFPDAYELIVVVEEVDADLFELLISPYQDSSPYPLRVVTEPTIMEGHIQQKYSKMRGDLYTQGSHILHLDADVVLFERVTYDHIFHLGKPVLPFRRFRRDDSFYGKMITDCWKNGTSFAIGEDVLHEYNIFNTHVYPRTMYPALRELMEKRHGIGFEEFMSTRRGQCMHPDTLARWTLEEVDLLLSDFNVMGAFLWFHMHDAVEWMAADPLDIREDEWRRDLIKYAWVCQANGAHFPTDKTGQDQYLADLLAVETVQSCSDFTARWANPEMLDVVTRTSINRKTMIKPMR